MSLSEQTSKILLCIGAAMFLAFLMHLSNQHHERATQRMSICATNGGIVNLAGECLPMTGRKTQ